VKVIGHNEVPAFLRFLSQRLADRQSTGRIVQNACQEPHWLITPCQPIPPTWNTLGIWTLKHFPIPILQQSFAAKLVVIHESGNEHRMSKVFLQCTPFAGRERLTRPYPPSTSLLPRVPTEAPMNRAKLVFAESTLEIPHMVARVQHFHIALPKPARAYLQYGRRNCNSIGHKQITAND